MTGSIAVSHYYAAAADWVIFHNTRFYDVVFQDVRDQRGNKELGNGVDYGLLIVLPCFYLRECRIWILSKG